MYPASELCWTRPSNDILKRQIVSATQFSNEKRLKKGGNDNFLRKKRPWDINFGLNIILVAEKWYLQVML